MKRITIIGSGGSGKSTLAIRVGNLLRIPVYHLDALYWNPGWVETNKTQWAATQEDLCKEPSWVIDGNYGGTIDIRLRASDTVIFLDTNRYVCLFRAIKRTIYYLGKSRADMGLGCKERFDYNFMKWIYGYPDKKKPEILAKLSKLSNTTEVHILKNRKDVNRFLIVAGTKLSASSDSSNA